MPDLIEIKIEHVYLIAKKLDIQSKQTFCRTHGVCGIHMKLCNLINVINEIKINHFRDD